MSEENQTPENGMPENGAPGNPPPQPPPPPQYSAPQPPPPQSAPSQGPYPGPTPRGYQGGPPPGGYMPTQPRQDKSWKWCIPVSLAVGCLPWVILFFVGIAAMVGVSGGKPSGEHIALIRVSGVITGGKSDPGFFDGSTAGSEDLIAQLEKARKNDDVAAIVIRINSPGGSAAGSEEVYNEIQRVRKDGKIVYTSMGDVAASGGYYIASASDKIYADAGTMTGSIGVIMHTADMSKLYGKIGFSPTVVKSGKFKDIGSSDRPMTAEERQLLQAMVNNIYTGFVEAVAKGRKIPFAEVKEIADGRIFTGNQAVKAKLVDKIGGLHETVRAAAKAAGIKGEPEVQEYQRKGILGEIFGSDDASSRAQDAVNRKIVEQLMRQGGLSRGLGE